MIAENFLEQLDTNEPNASRHWMVHLVWNPQKYKIKTGYDDHPCEIKRDSGHIVDGKSIKSKKYKF